ncbi:Uncharacterised protein [Buttiauxella agrestis]|uniref:DUF2570 domain-containing protein n=1 Tax=Buttiauxella agrestis TaxID=82977 RepID=A0A381C6B8_9ENTR|nr:Uncharacterised protein [Buttiauxella agrestis]
MITYFLLSLKTHWRWWLSIAAMVVIGWLWNENTRVNSSLATMQDDATSARTITSNVLRVVAITNMVMETNQHAKQQIALESQRAASDIKAAVASDDCAARPVPAVAANRLRQYADSLRTSATATNPSQPDR